MREGKEEDRIAEISNISQTVLQYTKGCHSKEGGTRDGPGAGSGIQALTTTDFCKRGMERLERSKVVLQKTGYRTRRAASVGRRLQERRPQKSQVEGDGRDRNHRDGIPTNYQMVLQYTKGRHSKVGRRRGFRGRSRVLGYDASGFLQKGYGASGAEQSGFAKIRCEKTGSWRKGADKH